MKFTITLHPVSLVVGAAALGFTLWLVSAAQATHASTGVQLPLTPGAPIEVKGIPTPGQMVRLTDGQFPYTVPSNRTFVVTGCVAKGQGQAVLCNLLINGQQIALVEADAGGQIFGQQATFTPGIVAKSGEAVDLKYWSNPSVPTNAVLLGYLSN